MRNQALRRRNKRHIQSVCTLERRQRTQSQHTPLPPSRHTAKDNRQFPPPLSSPQSQATSRVCCWGSRWSFFLFFPLQSMLLRYAMVMRRCVEFVCCYSARHSIPGQQFCNRGYGNITYVGAHNSYSVGVNDRQFYVPVFLLLISKPFHAAFANQDYDGERRYHFSRCFMLNLRKSHTATQRWREAAPDASTRQFWGYLPLSYPLRKYSHCLLCGTP